MGFNVQRKNGSGFDGFGYNPVTGELAISEVKHYTSAPCSASSCAALGMGKGDGLKRFENNLQSVRQTVEDSTSLTELQKRNVMTALDEWRFTVQLYEGPAGFKPDVLDKLKEKEWFENSNIPDPIRLPEVPSKYKTDESSVSTLP